MDRPTSSEFKDARSPCVILAHPECVPDCLTDDRSARRGAGHTIVSNPLEAMAEICLLGRIDASRAAWGLRPTGHRLLIIVGDHPETERAALNAALRRWAPDTHVLGVAEAGELPALLTASQAPGPPAPHPYRDREESLEPPGRPEAAAPPMPEPLHPPTGVGFNPPLRLVDSPGAELPPLPEDDLAGDDDEMLPSVGADELSMLLGDMDEDESSP